MSVWVLSRETGVWESIPEKGAWGEFHFGRVSFEEPTGHPGRASHEELAWPHTCPQHIHGLRTEVKLARGRVPGQAALLEGAGRGQGAPTPTHPCRRWRSAGSRLCVSKVADTTRDTHLHLISRYKTSFSINVSVIALTSVGVWRRETRPKG